MSGKELYFCVERSFFVLKFHHLIIQRKYSSQILQKVLKLHALIKTRKKLIKSFTKFFNQVVLIFTNEKSCR